MSGAPLQPLEQRLQFGAEGGTEFVAPFPGTAAAASAAASAISSAVPSGIERGGVLAAAGRDFGLEAAGTGEQQLHHRGE